MTIPRAEHYTETATEASRFFFDDPRLRMTIAGRLVVRVVGTVTYVVLIAATLTLLASDLGVLRGIGALTALFLIDRALHWRRADRLLTNTPHEGMVNLTRYLEPEVHAVIEKGYDHALLMHRHVFLEMVRLLLHFEDVRAALLRLDVRPEEFRDKLDELLAGARDERYGRAELRTGIGDVVVRAREEAERSGHRSIGVADVFVALAATSEEQVARLFDTFSIEVHDLRKALIFTRGTARFRMRSRLPSSLGGFTVDRERGVRHRVMNRAWTSRPTPTLDAHSTDFTDLARQGYIGFMVGHEKDYRRMVDALARSVNPNVLLVGDASIGKETMVARLAFEVVKDKTPKPLFDKRVVSLHLSSVVAGAAPEVLQERMQKIISEIMLAGNVILHIPDIHQLLETSGTAYLSAADALMPVIMDNAFPIVGATYPREFKRLIEPRSDFAGAFEVIHVAEITEDEAEEVLTYQSIVLERNGGVVVSFGAIKEAVRIASQYFHTKHLPSGAAELLKEAFALTKRKGEVAVAPHHIVEVAEAKVNVPIHEATQSEAEHLLNLEATIHERYIDQEEAVTAVSDALRQYRTGLARKGGPIASFLFVGPTGVGKTELAKLLAEAQFGSEEAMQRFDMSEYQDKQSFLRFIGSPDGSISGALTDAMLEKPYSLILLDEFEKAYPDILNLFLQVLDDGRLTDNLGRTVDFQNTIIIATSNAHATFVKSEIEAGKSVPEIAEILKGKLADYFKPELINRFSKIIVFQALSPEAIEEVARLNLETLAGTVAEQGITIAFDDAAVKKIAAWGYDPAFGARPLRQVIRERVRSPLAEKMLAGEVQKGNAVRVTVLDGALDFRVASTNN